MKIVRNITDLKKTIKDTSNLGFVPTMGGLHKGHLSLINKSKYKSKKTLVSIYVNPSQFNKKKDFLKYPKSIKSDLIKLRKNKVDFVFLPKTKEIYKTKRTKKLIISKKKNILCGKYRKGHFDGVIDIVDRLLKLINPNYMFLGEKDFQQLFLIKKYVKNKFKVKIIPCKTIRDKNYVALSSRNFLLSNKALSKSAKIAKKLKLIKNKIKKNNYKKELFKIKNFFMDNYNIKIEYLELRNEKDLSIYKKGKNFRIFIAYYINNVRLIDNY